MIIVGGTDKVVVGNVQKVAHILNLSGYLIYKFLGCYAGFVGLQFDFLTVLVGTGLEIDVIALGSFISGNTVCQHDFVVVSDVRLARCVGNGCCDVILFFAHFLLPFSLKLSCILLYAFAWQGACCRVIRDIF